MIRYIIEKSICNEYASGVMILMEDGRPKTFTSEAEAQRWLLKNDEEYNNIPITQLLDYYNIKPYVI